MSVVLEPVSDSAREEVEQPSVVEPDTAEEQPTEPPAQAADIQPKKRGRPRKVVDATEVTEKPKRGRPRKTPVTEEPSNPPVPDVDIAQFLLSALAHQQKDQLTQRRERWRHLISAKLLH